MQSNKASACYKTKVVKNWDALNTIYSSDHANGEAAKTGAESAQDSLEQADDASPELPQKRQRTGDAILCMLGDMKTSFKDALKSTEPLPLPHVGGLLGTGRDDRRTPAQPLSDQCARWQDAV